jgi:hypothetical protein
MNNEELSRKLQQHEERKNSLTSQMDSLYREIQAIMPHVAASWMTSYMEREIKEYPGVVQSLGIEQLKELKSKLKTLTDTLPEIVETEFRKSGIWPHHKVIPPLLEPDEPHWDRVFRNVISYLGRLLDEFGLIEGPNGHFSSWELTYQKRFRYTSIFIFPGPISLPEATINNYLILLDEWTSCNKKINDIKKSIASAKAIELWDKA